MLNFHGEKLDFLKERDIFKRNTLFSQGVAGISSGNAENS